MPVKKFEKRFQPNKTDALETGKYPSFVVIRVSVAIVSLFLFNALFDTMREQARYVALDPIIFCRKILAEVKARN